MHSLALTGLGLGFILMGAALFALTLRKPKPVPAVPNKAQLREQAALPHEAKKTKLAAGARAGVTAVPCGAYLDQAGQVVPLALANVDIGLLAVFAVSSLGVYSLILAGWASNSKYPFLGGVRASAQLISYELSMTLSVVPLFLWVNEPGQPGTLSLVKVVEFQNRGGFLGNTWFIFLMPLSAF